MCIACKARRRKAEALANATGDGLAVQTPVREMTPREALNADLPPLTTVPSPNGRTRIAEWVQIRAMEPNISTVDAAKRMGISANYLKALITRATKEGWLVFEDPLFRVEHELIPKTVDNLSAFLDAKDKQVTIEMAKGTIFKQFQQAQGITDAPQTILALKIEMPTSNGFPVATGLIMGTPKPLEIIDGDAV